MVKIELGGLVFPYFNFNCVFSFLGLNLDGFSLAQLNEGLVPHFVPSRVSATSICTG